MKPSKEMRGGQRSRIHQAKRNTISERTRTRAPGPAAVLSLVAAKAVLPMRLASCVNSEESRSHTAVTDAGSAETAAGGGGGGGGGVDDGGGGATLAPAWLPTALEGGMAAA